MAAVTHESMPPLNKTTALGFSVNSPPLALSFAFCPCPSDSPHRRVPDKLVQLQSQPHRQAIGQNPLAQLPRAHSWPRTFCVVHDRREDHLMNALGPAMPRGEVARKLVVAAAGEDEIDFIPPGHHVHSGRVHRISRTLI